MVDATVRSDHHTYGMFRFVELPRPGDRISVGNAAGGGDILDVLYVLHNPAPVPSRPFARQDPIATVVVRFREDFGGTL